LFVQDEPSRPLWTRRIDSQPRSVASPSIAPRIARHPVPSPHPMSSIHQPIASSLPVRSPIPGKAIVLDTDDGVRSMVDSFPSERSCVLPHKVECWRGIAKEVRSIGWVAYENPSHAWRIGQTKSNSTVERPRETRAAERSQDIPNQSKLIHLTHFFFNLSPTTIRTSSTSSP
jgi:hypothetical protein